MNCPLIVRFWYDFFGGGSEYIVFLGYIVVTF